MTLDEAIFISKLLLHLPVLLSMLLSVYSLIILILHFGKKEKEKIDSYELMLSLAFLLFHCFVLKGIDVWYIIAFCAFTVNLILAAIFYREFDEILIIPECITLLFYIYMTFANSVFYIIPFIFLSIVLLVNLIANCQKK